MVDIFNSGVIRYGSDVMSYVVWPSSQSHANNSSLHPTMIWFETFVLVTKL